MKSIQISPSSIAVDKSALIIKTDVFLDMFLMVSDGRLYSVPYLLYLAPSLYQVPLSRLKGKGKVCI